MMNSWFSFSGAAVVALSLVVLGCGAGEGDAEGSESVLEGSGTACASDEECTVAGETCQLGSCYVYTGSGTLCATDENCPEGETCQDGACAIYDGVTEVVYEASVELTVSEDSVGTACGVNGFCMDFSVDGDFCEASGGTDTSGLCNGGADIRCCEAAPCAGVDTTGAEADGLCVGVEEGAKDDAVACAGASFQSECPSTALVNGDVMCCPAQ